MLRMLLSAGLAGGAFATAMGVVLIPLLHLTGEARLAVFLCAACGFAFALTIAWFSLSAARHFHSRLPLHPGETMLHKGPANHLVGQEAVGGWLYLTDQRLVFVSHCVNAFVHAWEAPLSAVLSAARCVTKGLLPNGIRVETTDGTRQLVVSRRRVWETSISGTIAASRASGTMNRSPDALQHPLK